MVNNNTTKEYMKIYGVRIGSVNKKLFDMYCKEFGFDSTHKAVRNIIENYVLEEKIRSKQDVEEAMEFAGNLCYNSLCEMAETIARKAMQRRFNICSNCPKYEKGLCKFNNEYVKPLSSMCIYHDDVLQGEIDGTQQPETTQTEKPAAGDRPVIPFKFATDLNEPVHDLVLDEK